MSHCWIPAGASIWGLSGVVSPWSLWDTDWDPIAHFSCATYSFCLLPVEHKETTFTKFPVKTKWWKEWTDLQTWFHGNLPKGAENPSPLLYNGVLQTPWIWQRWVEEVLWLSRLQVTCFKDIKCYDEQKRLPRRWKEMANGIYKHTLPHPHTMTSASLQLYNLTVRRCRWPSKSLTFRETPLSTL